MGERWERAMKAMRVCIEKKQCLRNSYLFACSDVVFARHKVISSTACLEIGPRYDAPQPAARKRFRVFLQQVASRLSLVPVVLAMHAQKEPSPPQTSAFRGLCISFFL